MKNPSYLVVHIADITPAPAERDAPRWVYYAFFASIAAGVAHIIDRVMS